jgi:hypothetical protein
MKSLSIISLVIILLLTTGLEIMARESKKTFTSEQGNFSIAFPTEPTFETEPLKTKYAGDVIINSYFSEYNNVTYAASWIDYPISYIARLSAEELLKSAMDGIVANMNGKVLNQSNVSYGACSGKDFGMKVDSAQIRYRILLCGTRFYQLVTISEKSQIGSVFKNYVKSFKIN